MEKNAKQELLGTLKKYSIPVDAIKVAKITVDNKRTITKHVREPPDDFLNKINFEYQQSVPLIEEPIIHGFIWLYDGSWLERKNLPEREFMEIMSSWVFRKIPKCPEELLN